jgi:uncharacterized protein YggE
MPMRGTPLATLILTALPALALAQTRLEPVVVVSGEGLVQAVPDRAWVTISAESRASNPRDAQRRNAEAMAPVLDRIRGAKIPADAIRTVAYDLQPEWEMVGTRRVSRGYLARNTIEVRIDAVERVGDVLEVAVGSGATSVGGIRFDLKDRPGLERQAIRLAVADARAKADAAAAGAGLAVARVVRVEEQGVATPGPVPYMAMARQAAAGDTPPITAGQIEVRAHVTLTAEIK